MAGNSISIPSWMVAITKAKHPRETFSSVVQKALLASWTESDWRKARALVSEPILQMYRPEDPPAVARIVKARRQAARRGREE
ncbi:MAG: hypothetical protein ACRD6W_13340 [Nitrososphaerales archaeon]